MLILRRETHAAPALPWDGAWPETDDGREQWLGPGFFFTLKLLKLDETIFKRVEECGSYNHFI